MPLKIAILEDNAERIAVMRQWLTDHCSKYEFIFLSEAAPMIAWLRDNLSDTILISLDHDLEPPPGSPPHYDPGTGRDVADYLATRQPSCPMIIHSTNVHAVLGMMLVLEEADWHVEKDLPYEDTLWIGEAWRPLVKNILKEWVDLDLTSKQR